MQRRLEPELMNGDTQVQAYAAADFSSGDQATIEAIQRLLSRTSPLPPDPLVVDLGCGPGNITLRLAGLFPKARIIGIDGDIIKKGIDQQTHRRQNTHGVRKLFFLKSFCNHWPDFHQLLIQSGFRVFLQMLII